MLQNNIYLSNEPFTEIYLKSSSLVCHLLNSALVTLMEIQIRVLFWKG